MREKNKEGTALIIAITIIFTILVLAVSLMSISLSGSRLNQAQLDLLTARYTAKGALSATIIALNKNAEVLELQGNGAYWDSIIVKLSDNTWKQLANDLGEIVSPNAQSVYINRDKSLKKRAKMDFKVRIKPHGEKNFIAKACTVVGTIEYGLEGYILPKDDGKTFVGAFGDKTVDIRGDSSIDSYDSSLGTYSPTNMGEKCNIGSNGSISLDGNVKVYGDARPGTGYSINHPEKVTGDTTPHDKNIDLEPVDNSWVNEPTIQFPIEKEVTLLSGEYHFDAVELKSNTKLIIDGDVKIYCHGQFACAARGEVVIKDSGKLSMYVAGTTSFSGLFSTSNLYPGNFELKSIYDNRLDDINKGTWGVKITGNSNIYAVIYAPKSYILVSGNCDFFGSVVGYGVQISGYGGKGLHNAKFHYDVSLSRQNSDGVYFYLGDNFKSSFEEN